MKKIRVVVVEDSMTVRKRLIEVLSGSPEIEVVGEADDGKRAIELCQRLRPDVLTVDMILPGMSGLAVTEYVMAHCPTPILIVSASMNRGELFKTYEALAAGALDVLDKPTGNETDGLWEERLLGAVRLISRIKVITHPRAKLSSARTSRPFVATSTAATRLVAIGASTGGPGAITDVLKAVPAPCAVPILIVLHIAKLFGGKYAEWLAEQSRHHVSLAVDGESLAGARGRVLFAPPDQHLIVERGRVRLTSDPERHSCRPSVDVLFDSIAASELGSDAVACLLTGMGRDGATGLLAIRTAGGHTIAQDEESSVVYGMPREAALIGAATRILPLSAIGAEIATCVAGSASR